MALEVSAEEILERLKAGLKNSDNRIEGSFSMDNLQAVSQELARYASQVVEPLRAEIDTKIEEVITSGNENHYVFWAKQVKDSQGNKVVGNARAYGVRDGSGTVYLALITPQATAPDAAAIKLVKDYIETQRPVGAHPVIEAAEGVAVQVNGSVQLSADADLSQVTARAREAVSDYFAQIAFQRGQTALNYHRIGIILGSLEGVSEVMDYTLNGKEESIPADYDQFFTLGGLELKNVT